MQNDFGLLQREVKIELISLLKSAELITLSTMNEQETVEEVNNEEVTAAIPAKKETREKERRYRFAPRKRPQRSVPQLRWWREVGLAVCLITAVIFLINPFPRLARAQATLATPGGPLAVTPPQQPEVGYCVAGDFQGWDGRNTALLDTGTEGDATAGDGIYARTVNFAEPGRYLWRVLPCGQWNSAVPEKSAWLFVTAPNQSVTFTFNPNVPAAGMWPSSYALTANDTLPARPVVVGSFQNKRWNSDDAQTMMAPIGNEQYELTYRIPLPSTYETYVAIQGRSEGIGASGRSMEPVPLEFSTEFPAEMVIVQYDARTDRIAVLSGLPWWLSWLSYGWGARIIAAVALLGAAVLAVQIGYSRVVLRPELQYSAGCPTCQQTDLHRINRETSDYALNLIGVPVRRFKCNQCGWEGRRIYRQHHH
jgi:hypothetical protein